MGGELSCGGICKITSKRIVLARLACQVVERLIRLDRHAVEAKQERRGSRVRAAFDQEAVEEGEEGFADPGGRDQACHHGQIGVDGGVGQLSGSLQELCVGEQRAGGGVDVLEGGEQVAKELGRVVIAAVEGEPAGWCRAAVDRFWSTHLNHPRLFSRLSTSLFNTLVLRTAAIV
jgi:hypothetical protein